MRSVELFAGCGGLALGIAEAGFQHALVVENNPQASATLLANKRRRVKHFAEWSIEAVDVRDIDYSSLEDVDLVTGGPPCQPFSIGGRHKGPTDRRNMWPEAIRAVRELQPKAFLFENVRGLLRPAFERYLTYLRLQLTWPHITSSGRGWVDQAERLSKREQRREAHAYHVVVQGINTADYGAPQKRHRAIVLGIRADIAAEVTFPRRTHSHEALVWAQRVSGDYWRYHDVPQRARPALSPGDRFILDRLEERDEEPEEAPWVTVRDAIADLPSPLVREEPVPNHRLHPGARLYDRHTGSSWDEPAKALKAGDHGVPGGENVLVGRRGAVRYFTIREMARLQGFPDSFKIEGTWKAPIKQLGNAVPVQVGEAFGLAIREVLARGGARKHKARAA